MRVPKIAILSAFIGAGIYALISNLPATQNGSLKDPVAHTELAVSSTVPEEIAELLRKEGDFNDKCRDGIGNDPNKMEFCVKRDAVFDELTSKGWCWGKEGQAEYQMEWHPCEAPNRIVMPQAENTRDQSSSSDLVSDTRAPHPSGQYRFSLSAVGGFLPTINGTTDAPDGTILWLNIHRPWLPDGSARISGGLSPCGPNCLPAIDRGGNYGARITVKAGLFIAGPFSFAGSQFTPGVYPVEIFVLPDLFKPNSITPSAMASLQRPMFVSRLIVTERGELRFASGGCPVELLNRCPIADGAGIGQDQLVKVAPSFDCEKAKGEAEKLVCANINLSALDIQVADLYREVLSNVSDPNEMIGEQRDWLHLRDSCLSIGCLTTAYQNRLSELRRWSGIQNR